MSPFARIAKQKVFDVGSKIRSIEIHGFNGAITWTPIDAGAPRIVAEKEVRGLSQDMVEGELEELQVEKHISDGKMVLRATKPLKPFGITSYQVRFTLYASPQQITEFAARTSNGAIVVDASFNGRLDLKSSNGKISLRSGSGNVHIRTSNGRVDLGNLSLQAPSSVRTSNGPIFGQVAFPRDGLYSFETSNGSIELRVSHNTLGSIDARTSNGRVEFRVGEDQVEDRRQVNVQRGDGPSIRVSTSNGGISILGF